MTSAICSSKWVVYKSALKRLKWLGILYAVTLFLELPLLIWMELGKQKLIQGNHWADAAYKSFRPEMVFNEVVHFTNIVVPVVFGLILFYYLQNDRASTFFHNLPIKRWSLYCQNLLAGVTLIWLPILINGLLIYGVFTGFGVREGQWNNMYGYSLVIEAVNNSIPKVVSMGQAVLYWLFLSLLMTGLFYIITVFVGMLTGNILLQGALAFISLVLPLGLYLLVKFNLWRLLYGYPRSIEEKAEWLSPMVSYMNNQNVRLMFKSLTLHIWYIAAAAILCAASIYLYKKRPAEAAGETLAAGWIRWLFKYGVAASAALTGGVYLSAFNENSIAVLYLGYLIGGILGYTVADMIAYKSFHFYRRWKGLVVFGAVFIVLLGAVKLDFIGYQNYIPDQDEVKEVFLSSLNRDGFPITKGLKGEDNIRLVRELHGQIIKLEEENKARERDYTSRVISGAVKPMESVNTVIAADITYILDSGRKVKRSYMIDPGSYRKFLLPIFSTPEAKQSMFGRLYQMDEKKIDELNISNNHLGKEVRIYKRAEIDEALAALKKDVLNISYEAAVEGKEPPLANIQFIAKTGVEEKYGFYNLNHYQEYKNFEAFLTKHGYSEELFLDPGDVSKIIVKKVGSNNTVEIKDKEKIKVLLNWTNPEDERSFIMRQQQPVNQDMVEYYGKIEKKKGSPIFVMFDSSPNARQVIYKILKNN